MFSELATRLTGSLWLAWAMAVLVLLTGTLLFAIVLHAAYDVFAGFEYARLGRELGYPAHGLPDAAPDSAVTTSPAASSP